MAYVTVNRETTQRANDLRKEMMQEAIKMASGRSTQKDFNSAWMTFQMCYDQCQPADNLGAWLKSRLRNFYPVSVSEDGKTITVAYRHKSLRKRKRVNVPSLSGRWPAYFGLEDVSGRDSFFDVTKPTYLSGITKGPFHLTVGWEAK